MAILVETILGQAIVNNKPYNSQHFLNQPITFIVPFRTTTEFRKVKKKKIKNLLKTWFCLSGPVNYTLFLVIRSLLIHSSQTLELCFELSVWFDKRYKRNTSKLIYKLWIRKAIIYSGLSRICNLRLTEKSNIRRNEINKKKI